MTKIFAAPRFDRGNNSLDVYGGAAQKYFLNFSKNMIRIIRQTLGPSSGLNVIPTGWVCRILIFLFFIPLKHAKHGLHIVARPRLCIFHERGPQKWVGMVPGRDI